MKTIRFLSRRLEMKKRDTSQIRLVFDILLIISLSVVLLVHFLKLYPLGKNIFIILSFIGLLPVARSAFFALIRRQLTIDLLASIALVFSFLAQEWYSASFINLMIAFARIFDTWTTMRTKKIIEHLLKYRPTSVKIKEGKTIREIPIEQVKVGDLVIVEAGERIPVDGTVFAGQASVNESTLTGESEPVVKKVGKTVFTSTLNESGSLVVRAQKVGEDTTLSKIILLIEKASRNKAPAERTAAKFTKWYVLTMFIGSIILFLFVKNFDMVLAVLLVICADDIAVAVPLAFTAGISQAARRGIIVKGSDVLENLPKVTYFMTDKTGTLTRGKPKMKSIKIFPKLTRKKFLALLGTATINSGHPVSVAIIRYIKKQGVDIEAPDEFKEAAGEGMMVVNHGQKILAGKINFLEEKGVMISPQQHLVIKEVVNSGRGIVALGVNKKLLGFIVVEDEIRPFAYRLVQITKKLGVKLWIMLTGDNGRVASRIANELGIASFRANLKPEEKLDFIQNFKHKNKGILAMIGDGVNDAEALALADVSIAMGAIGSDAAIEAADVALMNDKLDRIPEVIIIGKRTMKVIKQNYFIWGSVNALGLLLVFMGILGPAGASAYNFATDFFPILNSLKIIGKSKWKL